MIGTGNILIKITVLNSFCRLILYAIIWNTLCVLALSWQNVSLYTTVFMNWKNGSFFFYDKLRNGAPQDCVHLCSWTLPVGYIFTFSLSWLCITNTKKKSLMNRTADVIGWHVSSDTYTCINRHNCTFPCEWILNLHTLLQGLSWQKQGQCQV